MKPHKGICDPTHFPIYPPTMQNCVLQTSATRAPSSLSQACNRTNISAQSCIDTLSVNNLILIYGGEPYGN